MRYLSVLLLFTLSFSIPHFNQYPDQPGYFPAPYPTENQPNAEGVALGRYLFYDSILSLDYSLSCASCHKQEYAFSDSPARFSVGIDGDTIFRNTMPLYNLAWYSSFFWDGRASSIEEQVFEPVRTHTEMGLSWDSAVTRISSSTFYQPKFKAAFGDAVIDSFKIAKAIAQFERTLISANSKYDRVLRFEDYFTPEEYAGFVLVNEQLKANCVQCHSTDASPLGTNGAFSNNGLDDNFVDLGRAAVTGLKEDQGKFRVPSLRNVALTAPYMHDGRFQTLEEVLDFYSEGVKESETIDPKMVMAHRGGVSLNDTEKSQIIAFLHTLTDSVFISNPVLANPFIDY